MAGSTEIRWRQDHRRKVTATVRRAAADAVSDAAEALLQDANKTAPHALGPLRGSGTVSVDRANATAAVAYDTPYAIRQHEDTRLRHPDPTNPASDPRGRAKWLQLALQEGRARYLRHIADRVSRATKGP